MPASYCGLYGIRPSHGRVPVKGIHPLAWSFDTCGLFAADGELLQRAARVLLQSASHRATAGPAEPLRSLVLATDLVDQADPAVAAAVRDGAAQLADELGIALTQANFGADRIPAWLQAFRARQMVEAWQANGRWITANQPRLGPGVGGRFAAARTTIPTAAVPATAAGIQVRRALEQALPNHAALVLPSAATVAPPPGSRPSGERGSAHADDRADLPGRSGGSAGGESAAGTRRRTPGRRLPARTGRRGRAAARRGSGRSPQR